MSTIACAPVRTSPPVRPASGATWRLTRTEIVLMGRDPLTLTFVFAFPVLTMLIIAGAFGSTPDQEFAGQNPAHWYVASYFTVVIGATGLIMLPVHLASYRERGVLRRFALAGFGRFSFALAQLMVGLATFALAGALLLAVAWPVYGIPPVAAPWRVGLATGAGAIAFISIGVLLGTVLRSARSAQAVGLLLFFPSFLIGVGGPPPQVLSPALRSLSEFLPLAVVTNAIREPWLDIGDGTRPLLATLAMAGLALTWAARRTAL